MIKLSAKVEARELKRYQKRLDKNRGKPLVKRAEWTLRAAAQRELVPRIKAEAKSTHRRWRGGKKKGYLARKTKAKFVPKRGGEDMRPTWVGSTAWYTHIVVGGSRRHSLGSRGAETVAAGMGWLWRVDGAWEHPGAKPKPFIDRGVNGALDAVYAHVKRDVFDTGNAPRLISF